MYHNQYSNIYLAHYGIKGMKWVFDATRTRTVL